MNIYDSTSAVNEVTCHRADAEALIHAADWMEGG